MGELWALRTAFKASVNSNMAFCGTCFVWDLTQGPLESSLLNVVQIQLFSVTSCNLQTVVCRVRVTTQRTSFSSYLR